MSNVPTAAEIAEKILDEAKCWSHTHISGSKLCVEFDETEFKEYTQKIIEEWAKQLQPTPDDSDMEVARKCSCDFVERNAQFISRHTEAKCAEAWRMGAKAAYEKAASSLDKLTGYTVFSDKNGDKVISGGALIIRPTAQSVICALPIPKYKGKK